MQGGQKSLYAVPVGALGRVRKFITFKVSSVESLLPLLRPWPPHAAGAGALETFECTRWSGVGNAHGSPGVPNAEIFP